MEFSLEPTILGLTGILYAVMLVVIWVFNCLMMTWEMPIKTKILASICMLPITYMIVNGMASQ